MTNIRYEAGPTADCQIQPCSVQDHLNCYLYIIESSNYVQNAFCQSGSDSRWFQSKKLKKKKTLMELETPSPPSWKIPLRISILFFGIPPLLHISICYIGVMSYREHISSQYYDFYVDTLTNITITDSLGKGSQKKSTTFRILVMSRCFPLP